MAKRFSLVSGLGLALATMSALSPLPASAADLIHRPASLGPPAPAVAGSSARPAGAEPVAVDSALLLAEPEALWLELAPGEGRWAQRTALERTAGGLVWRGRFADDDPSYTSITLTLDQGRITGTFEVPHGPAYRLRPLGGDAGSRDNGTLRAEERTGVDCGVGHGLTEDGEYGESAEEGTAAWSPRGSGGGGAATGEAGSEREISILVLYTPAAARRSGGDLRAGARHNVDLLNTAFLNSGVDGRAVLAAAVEADLGLAGDQSQGDVLRHSIEHPLAMQLQNRWAADVVSVVVASEETSDGLCGYANVMFRRMNSHLMASRAFNLISEGCFHSNYVFVHEVAHNLGAQHDPANASSPEQAVYPWSFAHGADGGFRTLMSTGRACDDCRFLHNVFSNPLRSIGGEPTGIADERDNSLTLNLTIPVVATFRAGAPSPSRPAAPGDLAAQAVSPTAVALSWTDNASDETGFEVEARAAAAGAWQRQARLGADATGHVVAELEPGTAYRFRVRATGSGPPSGYSDEAAAETPPAAPVAPASLTAEPLSATEVALHWRHPAEAAHFEVELRSADPAADRAPAPIAAGPEGAIVGGLAAATPYTLRVRAIDEYGTSDWSAAASVTTPSALPGAPCTPDGTTLCLLDGRFEARARWRNPRPPFGHGLAAASPAPGRGGTGAFTFFDPTNVELVVKLLDARVLNGAFWHFYGALSDVEYWISLRDTASDESRTYHNPPFELCGRGDTSAFPAPEDGAAAPSRASLPPLGAETAPGHAVAPAGAGCAPDHAAHCLAGGRFRVEVEWENPHLAGDRGIGRTFAGLSTDQTGHFWFFDPHNLELAVKILDGRAVNGHFWILWGGLSDVGYTIHVTDTESGQAHDFVNPPLTLCGGAVTDLL